MVRYEAEASIENVIECNCSHCFMKGLILIFIPKSQFNLLSQENTLVEYRFNKRTLGHMSCKECSVQVFATGKGKDDVETVALNVRCIDNVDLKEYTIHSYNGKDI